MKVNPNRFLVLPEGEQAKPAYNTEVHSVSNWVRTLAVCRAKGVLIYPYMDIHGRQVGFTQPESDTRHAVSIQSALESTPHATTWLRAFGIDHATFCQSIQSMAGLATLCGHPAEEDFFADGPDQASLSADIWGATPDLSAEGAPSVASRTPEEVLHHLQMMDLDAALRVVSSGWVAFSYPMDQDRIPLVTEGGDPYPLPITGKYRREGSLLNIVTADGCRYTAQLQEQDGDLAYVLLLD